MRSSKTRKARVKDEEPAKVEEEKILPTELALGSDGRLYVNCNGIDPALLEGRVMFHGYAMTDDETMRAVREIHRLAFNVTVTVQPLVEEPPPRPKRRKPKRAIH